MIGLAAYQPDIAPNLGAMIRISACFGLPLDIIEPCGFPLSVKALRRSAMDYANIADMTRHDSWEAFRKARAQHRLVLLTTAGATGLWDFSFRQGDIILTGRESAGVPPQVAEAADARLRIPMPGGGRSLNVAVAAAIALAEAMRQLRPEGAE
ncbi:MAG: TrmH family RNA methyltransferase [Paracoccaceae bacterium]|nr:TrmH family RNA methyltransferase [Paracoccaceae bacterium]